MGMVFITMRSFGFLVILVGSFFSVCCGYYLPGTFPNVYKEGDEVQVKVNSLTSLRTELPYSYYSLPFCKPPQIKKAKENLGELLMGDLIENSVYKFKMLKEEFAVKGCEVGPLTADEVNHFKIRIDDLYHINMILDNLPVTMMAKALESNAGNVITGFPIGGRPRAENKDGDHLLYNHLKFRVLYHKADAEPAMNVINAADDGFSGFASGEVKNSSGYMIVGFEVMPCSMQRPRSDEESGTQLPRLDCSPQAGTQPQLIKEREYITYSYDVEWHESAIRWPSRWDAYLKMEGDHVHWFSILNSLMVVCFLAGIVVVILLRTVRRDLAKYEDLEKNADDMADEGGWKLVAYDVFRAPRKPGLLCVFVGDGVQLGGMAAVTVLFAALGFMSPASRGMLLTGMIIMFLLLGILAGYVASRLWCSITSSTDGWRDVAWKTACFFPGLTFGIMLVLNTVLWHNESTGAMPFLAFFTLFALWFLISVPLTYIGAYVGTLAERVTWPVKTNQIPRHIPDQRYPTLLLVIGAGILPFGTVFIELFFIMSSIWLHRTYYVFGFLLIVMILLCVVCAEVAVVLTYVQLCMEDYRWWWKAFLSSGSVALYTFIYAINYFFFDLRTLSGLASIVLYLGYMLVAVLAIFLATGTVGFVSSMVFVHYLFSAVKLD